ncbi:MAG: TPM domain-containing protein [Deltaproteobacteria bacterium]|nr:TPM domain-containing protein [Deltaproteobacteria bacterium]
MEVGRPMLFQKNLLSRTELREIAEEIARAEASCSGEIRICIQKRKRRKDRHLSLFDRALMEFQRLGMHRTEYRTGVLLFICLQDHVFQIIADEGIHKKLPQSEWDALAKGLSKHFKGGNFCRGICEIVRRAGEILKEHFPKRSDDRNELSDEVVID